MRRIALAAATLGFASAATCQTFFPPPPAPTNNQTTTQKALLGMTLFWEEQMSTNDAVACGTCHSFGQGGTDERPLGTHAGYDGIFGTADDVAGSRGVAARGLDGNRIPSSHGFDAQVTPRKAPSVINVAYQDRLFYDGRVREGDFRDPITNQVMATGPTALENLVLQPPLNPIEMGHPGRTWQDVVAKLAASQPLRLADQLPARLQNFIGTSTYPQLFQRVFGTPEVTPTRVAFAIASYMRTLISDQSRFDYVLGGVGQLTAQETIGRQIFEGNSPSGGGIFSTACVRCHGDLSTGAHTSGPSARATTMYGQTPTGNFHNTGLRPDFEDLGSGGISGLANERGRFKVPFLRNVALHTAFGHNQQMRSLAEVVEFYDRGGDFHTNQAPEIQPLNLTQTQKDALVAFLDTLTDPRVANGVVPFDSPRLGSQNGNARPTTLGYASAAGSPNVPVLVANEPMFLGSKHASLAVSNVAPNTLAALLWDSQPNPTGIDLLGVTLYVGLQQPALTVMGSTTPAGNGKGWIATTFEVPNLQYLAGTQVVAQWLVLDPSANHGLTASAAAVISL